MTQNSDPIVFVVCGAGGVGKGTIVAELVSRDASLHLSRSWTTRGQRAGEANDAYVYVTEEEFKFGDQIITRKGFICAIKDAFHSRNI